MERCTTCGLTLLFGLSLDCFFCNKIEPQRRDKHHSFAGARELLHTRRVISFVAPCHHTNTTTTTTTSAACTKGANTIACAWLEPSKGRTTINLLQKPVSWCECVWLAGPRVSSFVLPPGSGVWEGVGDERVCVCACRLTVRPVCPVCMRF